MPWPLGHRPLSRRDLEYAEAQAEAMFVSGLADSLDDALHRLLDCGEIDEHVHCRLLSPGERARVYGSRR